MTTTVDVADAQAHLAELLKRVAEGEQIVLADENGPVAWLLPASVEASRVANLHPGAMEMQEDFDEPLPDAFWTGTS
ncbi:MAG: type II toxin-antitoxin system Phd/YefM family antitoxin [Rhodothermales bacterium]